MVETHEDVHVEQRDISLKFVVTLFISTLAFLVALTVGFKFVIHYQTANHRLVAAATQPQRPGFDVNKIFPAPRLQVWPNEELIRFQNEQQKQLEALEWVDRGGGVARVPIETAMSLLLERGLPVQQKNGSDKQGEKEAPADGHQH